MPKDKIFQIFCFLFYFLYFQNGIEVVRKKNKSSVLLLILIGLWAENDKSVIKENTTANQTATKLTVTTTGMIYPAN